MWTGWNKVQSGKDSVTLSEAYYLFLTHYLHKGEPKVVRHLGLEVCQIF